MAREHNRYPVDGTNMTVPELVSHEKNVSSVGDSVIRARLQAGDKTLERLLRPATRRANTRKPPAPKLMQMKVRNSVTEDWQGQREVELIRPHKEFPYRTKDGYEWKYAVPVVEQDEKKAEPRQAPAITKRALEASDGSTAAYYDLPDSARQLQDLIAFKNMNAQVGEVFRACYRYGQVAHSTKLRDAKKMLFYVKAEIDRLEQWEQE